MKIFLWAFLLTALLSGGTAWGCNVCHSKNPKMVQMHKELGYKDCFACHAKGMKKEPEERKIQMRTDSRCIRCHKTPITPMRPGSQ